jgi:N,N'-diacetyllegionaminate synthase
MARIIRFGNRLVGDGQRVYLIAEAGINHNGDVELARQLIAAAKDVGADAVKFQSFETDRFICKSALSAPHVDRELCVEGTFYDLLKKLELSPESYPALHEYAMEVGIPMTSSPFDERYVDLLDRLNVPFFKIASMDLDNLDFIRYIARKKRPLVLSTGMGTLAESAEAVDAAKSAGNDEIVLLHCTSQYPPEAKDVNLAAIRTLQAAFPDLLVGYSDHTIGVHVPVGAAALGAAVIEKHFTLDKRMPGPDQKGSADPQEMKSLRVFVDDLAAARGTGVKAPTAGEEQVKKAFRRSVVMVAARPKGHVLSKTDLAVMRPGTGIGPKHLDLVVGRRLRLDVQPQHILSWGDLD